jgi:hypothetical protein
MSRRIGLSRTSRGRLFAFALLFAGAGRMSGANAAPHIPSDDAAVLAELSTGTHYADVSARRLARGRADVAVPLAQFYIQQSRLTGDLRFLGYAEAVLSPWLRQAAPNADVLVLQATLQQSRHDFPASLSTLDRSLTIRPKDP